jgi:hypothetical protein
MVKDMELRFEKWKIERGTGVDQLNARIAALTSENARLNERLKLESNKTRVVYQKIEQNGSPRVIDYSKDIIDREDIFDWFINEAWTAEHTRDEWVELLHDPKTERPALGRKRFDDYRRILAQVGLWNMDANKPLGDLDHALEVTSATPPPHPAEDAGGGRAGESSTN